HTDPERVESYAIYTLPRADLPSVVDRSTRFKRNAYHALKELNHYHLIDRPEEPAIRFPDGPVRGRDYPFKAVYLATPRQADRHGTDDLNRAIADRIFLNSFASDVDPAQGLADVPIQDARARAHIFCTFGLSTVEFPAQQVMDACSKRLLSWAI